MTLVEERSPSARPTAQRGVVNGFRLSAFVLSVLRPLLLVSSFAAAALLARSWRAWPLAVGLHERMHPRDTILFSHCRCLEHAPNKIEH